MEFIEKLDLLYLIMVYLMKFIPLYLLLFGKRIQEKQALLL